MIVLYRDPLLVARRFLQHRAWAEAEAQTANETVATVSRRFMAIPLLLRLNLSLFLLEGGRLFSFTH